MMTLKTSAVLLICILIASAAQAAQNSRQRVRSFARLPDWSGVWEQFDIGPNGSPSDPAEDKAFHASLLEHPPYNDVWEAKFPAGRHSAVGQDMPVCSIGFPALMVGTPQMFQLVIAPEQVAIIFSLRGETRQIYTNGQGHAPPNEILPTPFGDSTGHWEAQTLIVETIATSSPANLRGDRLSEQARFLERIWLVNADTLEDQITVEDPVALRSDWRLIRLYHRVPSMTRLIEQDCQGNDRNPVVDGKFTIIVPAAP